jgi:glucose-6-phosphate 1-dehydrogenase
VNPVEPHLFVIFGATGDLTQRKLIPSLYRIVTEGGAGNASTLLGVSRQELDDGRYRSWTRDAIGELGPAEDVERWCDEHVFYHAAPEGTESLDSLRRRIEEIEQAMGLTGNRIFYLALPPGLFPPVIEQLGAAGLAASPGWTRVVIEKPFGRDLESARALNATVHGHFAESQVYRIDHYLGKETVQNLLAFRFANLLFESAWNRDRIESVEITVAEDLGTEGRAGYYDRAGVLRDMVQNHLTQLLSLIAMEAPRSFEADPIRAEKIQLLEAIRPIDPGSVTFGQYEAGVVSGREVPAYRDDPEVVADSTTPTFVAMRLDIANWRWAGVPFFLRTGKRLAKKTTHIAVTFHRSPVCIFHGVLDECPVHQNVLVLVLQPNEGFELRFDVKMPGEPLRLQAQPLTFHYDQAYASIPDAYQTLLFDVMTGDQTLFVHADEVEAAWRLYTPLLGENDAVAGYEAGTWGPTGVDEVLGRTRPWIGLK